MRTSAYQLHLIAQKRSWSHINQTACALRFFYGVTLGRQEAFERIVSGREPEKLSPVLSPEEIARFLEAVAGLRNRVALTADYGAGLRIGEVDPEQRDIVNRFSNPRSRLLVTALQAAGPAGGEVRATVEVAHEALIRHWPTLRDWVRANRENLRARAAILRAKGEWEEHRQDETFLLDPGVQLERGRALLANPGDVAVDDIRDYVARSIEKDQRRLGAERDAAVAATPSYAIKKGVRYRYYVSCVQPIPRGPRVTFRDWRRLPIPTKPPGYNGIMPPGIPG